MSQLTPHVKPAKGTRRRKMSETVETGIAIAEAAHKTYLTIKEWRRRRFSYSVTISESDGLYQDVHDWLLSVFPHEKHHSLVVTSSHRTINQDVVGSEMSPENTDKMNPLKIRFNDKKSRILYVGGHRVEVALVEPDTSEKHSKFFERNQIYNDIVFTAFSYEAQQAVIQQLEKLNQARATTRKAVLKMTTSWGDWRTRSDLPPRSMDSVSLPKSQKDRIVSDLDNFLKSEERYNRLAIPWHRGYMFYGPPGTGKTSLVKALANHFNLDLWYISISDLSAESSLLSLIGGVGPRSILLLEDIDTVKIAHDRDSSDTGKISTGSLLNTLDGVATPHGLITIMTTNRFDILDPALKRAGRMDLIEELGYPTIETISDLWKHFYGTDVNIKRALGTKEINQVSTSQVAEVFKRNFENPKSAKDELQRLLFDKE